jgi:selenocysteine lyase/cysteine desulfurase
MTLTEILRDEALRRHEFPVVRDSVFLAHAGVCPLPRVVSAAIRDYAERCAAGDQEAVLSPYRLSRTRGLAARLLSCGADEIAFVGPTSLALSFVASGVAWQRGDNVVIYAEDYPSNVYPWMALEARGVQVRSVRPAALGAVRLEHVQACVDDRTRLVSLASAHYVSGYRIDVPAIGAFLRARGVLFCVDAIQSLGALPTTVEGVDFLAADAHKWMLGPCAAGILYVRREVQAQFQPPVYGWHSVRCRDYVAELPMALQPDSRRYEPGTFNWLGLVGMDAGLELLLELGIDTIGAELLRKRARLVQGLGARGYEVLGADSPPGACSGILSFDRPGLAMEAVHERLRRSGVVTSLRADRSGRRYIRLSPHAYTTDADLERALDLV